LVYAVIAAAVHWVAVILLRERYSLLPGGVLVVIFLIATTLSAVKNGLGPGLLTLAASAYLVNHIWFRSEGIHIFATPIDRGRALVFLLSGAIIALLSANARRSQLRARSALLEATAAEERLNALVRYSPVEIFIKDSHGRYLLTNERFDELRGFRVGGKCTGKLDSAIFPPEIAKMLSGHDQQVIRDRSASVFDELIPISSGDLRQYSTIKFPVFSRAGEFFGVGGISTDVTIQRQQKEALERAVRARDEVLAVVSHDLKNPLNGIELNCALISRIPAAQSDERIKSGVDRISRATQQMERLIQDILDVSKLEAGKIDLDLRTIDAVDLALESVRDLEELARAKKLSLKFQPKIGSCLVRADSSRLQRVFANLIGNSIKFTPEGGQILVTVSADEDFARFEVSDSGSGIQADDLPHIFDRFWQAKETAKKGTGLGLPIAKGIVEAHGGTIQVESESSWGTRFRFTLPRAERSVSSRSA
jgi:PAS domain S-box-containing protein